MSHQNIRYQAPERGELTSDMLSAFEHSGVLVLEDFYSVNQCDSLRARAAKLIVEADIESLGTVFSTRSHSHTQDDYFQSSGDKIRFFLEDDATNSEGTLLRSAQESVNKIGHALHDLDPCFDKFSRTPELAEVTSRLGLQKPQLLQSMYIFKSAGVGGEVSCHQDSSFIYTEPMSCIGFWVALEDATIENGCLFAVPGEHKRGITQRFRKIEGQLQFEPIGLDGTSVDSANWPSQAIPLEAKKGSLVVLHGALPHLSAANRSPYSRHAYTLHVIDGVCDYPSDNWLQRAENMPLRGFV